MKRAISKSPTTSNRHVDQSTLWYQWGVMVAQGPCRFLLSCIRVIFGFAPHIILLVRHTRPESKASQLKKVSRLLESFNLLFHHYHYPLFVQQCHKHKQRPKYLLKKEAPIRASQLQQQRALLHIPWHLHCRVVQRYTMKPEQNHQHHTDVRLLLTLSVKALPSKKVLLFLYLTLRVNPRIGHLI